MFSVWKRMHAWTIIWDTTWKLIRKIVCYRGDGKCKSRLDRMLVNNAWIQRWPNSRLKGLDRSISDHCPILMEIKSVDWGPKPFRSINAWLSHPSFKDFVTNRWQQYEVQGWGSFVIKEKFKLLKVDLKEWNEQVFGVIERNINSYRDEINGWIC